MMIDSILILLSPKVTSLAAGIVGGSCKGGEFLGLKAWWYYLPSGDFNGCKVTDFNFLPANGQSDLVLILLAVVDDLLIIAGVVAVAFVIVGAFQYINSQGDPEKTAQARSTIINALVGTAIAITATVFVNFLGQRLG